MIDKLLPNDLEARQRLAVVLAGVSLVTLGIGVFLLKAGDFESGVRIASQTASSEANVSDEIWVDVEGEVKAPGVYKLAFGSRVQDALQSAGGLTENADGEWVEKNVNKAQVVTDGYKLYVPDKLQSNITQVSSVSDGIISINSSTQQELEILPGVGPATAKKIISGRPYGSLEELKEKKIIGAKLWEDIKDQITLW